MKALEIIALSLRALNERDIMFGLYKSSLYKKEIAQPVPSKAKESFSLLAVMY